MDNLSSRGWDIEKVGWKRIEERGGEKGLDTPTPTSFSPWPCHSQPVPAVCLSVCLSVCACMLCYLPTLSPFYPKSIRPCVSPFHKPGYLYPLPLECWLFPLCLGHLIGPVLCHSFCNFMGFPPVDQVPGSKYPRRKCFCIIFFCLLYVKNVPRLHNIDPRVLVRLTELRWEQEPGGDQSRENRVQGRCPVA